MDLNLNWRVLGEYGRFHYYLEGKQRFWNGKIADLRGPDGAKYLLNNLKGPDWQFSN